jgi:hypothetical protein
VLACDPAMVVVLPLAADYPFYSLSLPLAALHLLLTLTLTRGAVAK